ncbi:MAG TPA: NAD-dependent epimerase/dehydratase family protein [Pyrinomonadaceae bacterium]|nr:NAD-dependent epimerase/dehydratase family protein [Pyrinomonadaceae bacterium]
MKALVTGGSGYLGTHVRRFFDADDFSRRSHLDILDENDLGLISSYDLVIHLAAHLDKAPVGARQCFATNAEGTADVLRHISPGAVLIYASTKDVYGPHADSYNEVPEECSTEYAGQTALEWSKLIGERYVEYYSRLRKVRSCIFRLSTVYARPSDGNESGFVTHYVESVKRGWPIRLPLGGHPVRDILHVDDFSRACQAFYESGRLYGLYNLGGGKGNSASLREIIAAVGRMIALEPVIAEDEALPHPVPVNYISDLTRIREELNWRPQISLEEGLRTLL